MGYVRVWIRLPCTILYNLYFVYHAMHVMNVHCMDVMDAEYTCDQTARQARSRSCPERTD